MNVRSVSRVLQRSRRGCSRGRRDVIRQSWTLADPANMDFKFFVGPPFDMSKRELQLVVDAEARLHGDIVLLDGFTDSYLNLTKKTLAILQWVDENENFEFLVKMDDDTFPDVRAIHQRLLMPQRSNLDVQMGRFIRNAVPVRNPSAQWYVSPQEYPSNQYPAYAIGPLYVLGAAYVRRLAEVLRAEGTLEHACKKYGLIAFEDVSMGLLASQIPPAQSVDVRAIRGWKERGASLANFTALCDHYNKVSDIWQKHMRHTPAEQLPDATEWHTCRRIGTRVERGRFVVSRGFDADVLQVARTLPHGAAVAFVTGSGMEEALRAAIMAAAPDNASQYMFVVNHDGGGHDAAAEDGLASLADLGLAVFACGGCEARVLPNLLRREGCGAAVRMLPRLLVRPSPSRCGDAQVVVDAAVRARCATQEWLVACGYRSVFNYNWVWEAWSSTHLL
eukprot:TRINITY_DN89_c0_g1_i4.p1 TRINITY_DN89_c0_g1~~TRINITY_DN89_c0_g1_i4.p1  ORF type:complete len:448 (-),score=116.34 TRINITY_DN89_c0_g1_i4:839-2182(-)